MTYLWHNDIFVFTIRFADLGILGDHASVFLCLSCFLPSIAATRRCKCLRCRADEIFGDCHSPGVSTCSSCDVNSTCHLLQQICAEPLLPFGFFRKELGGEPCVIATKWESHEPGRVGVIRGAAGTFEGEPRYITAGRYSGCGHT